MKLFAITAYLEKVGCLASYRPLIMEAGPNRSTGLSTTCQQGRTQHFDLSTACRKG